MQVTRGSIAWVTGAGSGIGRALVLALARRGLTVAACDIREAAAQETARMAGADGGTVHAYALDVSDAAAVEAVADRVERDLGPVSLVFNNAGVAMHGRRLHEVPLADWDWAMGVNVMGTVHGVRAWVPRLLSRPGPARIVNTASLAGFQVNPAFLTGPYCATKYAVVALSEALEQELSGTPVGVSVVCPAAVDTALHLSGQSRPEAAGGAEASAANRFLGDLIKVGQSADEIAAKVLTAIEEDRFYVFTHPETEAWLQRRFDRILGAFHPALEAKGMLDAE